MFIGLSSILGSVVSSSLWPQQLNISFWNSRVSLLSHFSLYNMWLFYLSYFCCISTNRPGTGPGCSLRRLPAFCFTSTHMVTVCTVGIHLRPCQSFVAHHQVHQGKHHHTCKKNFPYFYCTWHRGSVVEAKTTFQPTILSVHVYQSPRKAVQWNSLKSVLSSLSLHIYRDGADVWGQPEEWIRCSIDWRLHAQSPWSASE